MAPASLLDLFDGRRQLVVYRAFYAPDVTTYPESGGAYPERACAGCSFLADQVAHPAHLNARDTTLVFVSRAPQAEIQGLKERMGWELIPWYSITDDFDADFGVDEWHGHNAFIRDGDKIFRTYFTDARGDEALGTTWSYLDITALGRQEEWEDSPEGYPQSPSLRVVELPRRLRQGLVIAHVSGVPLEELLPSLSAAGAGLLVARAWIMLRLRRRREPGT